MQEISRSEGAGLFGLDPAGYDQGRPDYPDWIFTSLINSGALFAGAATLEIGPGSGLATRHLIERGADPITLVEPDERLAAHLREALADNRTGSPGTSWSLMESSFEDAVLPDAHYDLVAVATAFHWLNPDTSLEKIRRHLKPGGTTALIWNVFQDLHKADPFHEATRALLAPLASSPSGAPDSLPFALDQTAREAQARKAGFTEIVYQESRWSYEIDPEQVSHLYGNFSSIQRLEPEQRSRLLDQLRNIAESEFHGRVRRNMTSCLYQLR